MAIFDCKNLTFSYSDSGVETLQNINLSIEEGGFYLICGKSGSGKTTLLKLLKPEIAPNGKTSGEILFEEQPIKDISARQSCRDIGFVMQDINGQLVCDKVWNELAFGLGNLGYSDSFIASRIAEVSEYFGISTLFDKKISELSGGSKQIVALASIIVMNPKVLLLDEPTSMLDPIARKNFVNMLERVNRELGVTIVVVEHNLQDFIDIASEIIILDNGKIVAKEKPNLLCEKIKNEQYSRYIGLPEFAEIFVRLGGSGELPKGTAQAKMWLKSNFANSINSLDNSDLSNENQIEMSNQNLLNNSKIDINCINDKKNSIVDIKKCNVKNSDSKVMLTAKKLYFRYAKNSPDIVKNANLLLTSGEIVCLVGGNGVGKTTFINLLSGVFKPLSGKVMRAKCGDQNVKLSVLPQDAKSLFVEQTVKQELYTMAKLLGVRVEKVDEIIKQFELEKILDNHPYDISGGEVQKLAMAKLLLNEPDIIILDEPTQGVDKSVKEYVKKLLCEQKANGKAILIITHDLQFASEVADRVGMFFDGQIVSLTNAKEFFENNSFYTTQSSLISRGHYIGAYTTDLVVKLGQLNGKIADTNN